MATNLLLASDNFSSGSLGSGWTAWPALTEGRVVLGTPNVIEPQGVNNNYGQYRTDIAWPKDQISEVTIQAVNSTGKIALGVRINSDGDAYLAVLSGSGTLYVYSYVSSTLTQLGSPISGLTFSLGDVYTFAAIGACIVVYKNNQLVFYTGDASIPSGGSPGFYQFVSGSITDSQISAWRGYSGVQQDGVWTKQGVILAPNAAELVNNHLGSGLSGLAGIRFEGSAQVLSGNVYKGYFSAPEGLCYVESYDGINWVRYSGNPILPGYAAIDVFKHNGIYYVWSQQSDQIEVGPAYLFTSIDGVTWAGPTLTNLSPGDSGSWDEFPNLGPNIVDNIGGIFYGLYSALDRNNANRPSTGIATSPDGITWTKYSGNPILMGVYCGGAQIVKIENAYYAWMAANQPGQGSSNFDPLETVLYKSTDLLTWTFVHKSLHNTGMWESLNSKVAGNYGTAAIQIGNRAALYYEGSPNDEAFPEVYQCGLALGPIGSTLASIVAGNEDATVQIASDGFTGPSGPLNSNWSTPSFAGANSMQIGVSGSAESTVTATAAGFVLYTGTSFDANQYAEITMGAIASSDYAYIVLRGSLEINTNYLFSIPQLGVQVSGISVLRVVDGSTQELGVITFTPQVNDVIRFVVITGDSGQAILSVYQNGFLIQQIEDWTPITSGMPGMAAFANIKVTDVQIKSFAAGNAGVIPGPPTLPYYSVPDCRNYGNFPNDAVDIQGTETYTVSRFESRAAGAPTDSRSAGAPLDCRIYSNIPKNSRTY